MDILRQSIDILRFFNYTETGDKYAEGNNKRELSDTRQVCFR